MTARPHPSATVHRLPQPDHLASARAMVRSPHDLTPDEMDWAIAQLHDGTAQDRFCAEQLVHVAAQRLARDWTPEPEPWLQAPALAITRARLVPQPQPCGAAVALVVIAALIVAAIAAARFIF